MVVVVRRVFVFRNNKLRQKIIKDEIQYLPCRNYLNTFTAKKLLPQTQTRFENDRRAAAAEYLKNLKLNPSDIRENKKSLSGKMKRAYRPRIFQTLFKQY